MLARDRYHQYQWIAAIAELEEKNGVVVPASFPPEAYEFWNLSEGNESGDGLWAIGSAPDGTGDFVYVAEPVAKGQIPNPKVPAAQLHCIIAWIEVNRLIKGNRNFSKKSSMAPKGTSFFLCLQNLIICVWICFGVA